MINPLTDLYSLNQHLLQFPLVIIFLEEVELKHSQQFQYTFHTQKSHKDVQLKYQELFLDNSKEHHQYTSTNILQQFENHLCKRLFAQDLI